MYYIHHQGHSKDFLKLFKGEGVFEMLTLGKTQVEL